MDMKENEKKGKYYWIKLNTNFFEQEEVKIIEMQQNGYKYITFYLKLILKSANTDGRLLFRDIIPYSPEMLSNITGTDIDTVRVALDLFENLGLLEKLSDGALFMVEVKNMVGSETKWAEKKRLQREKKKKELPEPKEDIVPVLSQKVRQEKEKELEEELEEDINTNSINICDDFSEVFKHMEMCGFRLTPIQVQQLNFDIEQFGGQWVKDAARVASDNGKISYSYMKGILENWNRNGKKVVKGNEENRGDFNRELKDEGIGL